MPKLEMANPEHVNRLLGGVEQWNEWRRSGSSCPDLSSCENLRERILQHLEIPPPNHNFSLPLSGIDFSNTNLERSNFHMSDLRDADLSYSNLKHSTLTDSTLQNANLEGADLRGTNFCSSTLVGANLTGTKLWEAVLYSEPPQSLTPIEQSSKLEMRNFPETIRDISDLLKTFKKLRAHYANFPNEQTTFYFRGESVNSCSWKLRPAVMRQSKQVEEGEMLFDLLSRRPEDFRGMSTALSQWVLAQHHGLKTRLLDITRNPLVGLFNACHSRDEEHNEANGRVHVFAMPRVYQVSTNNFRPIKSFNSDTISVIANFAKLSLAEQLVILGKGGVSRRPHDPREITYGGAMRRLYHFIRQERPNFDERIDPRDLFSVFVVEPEKVFERIRAQDGAFLISAFHNRFEETELRKWNNGIPYYHHYMLNVPSCKKHHLLEQLQVMNITRESLFPSLDEAADATNQKYISP